MQLQDLHSWSFGRPDLKALKEDLEALRDKANSEEIPLEGLSNGLEVQELDATNDRSHNDHVSRLTAPSLTWHLSLHLQECCMTCVKCSTH